MNWISQASVVHRIILTYLTREHGLDSLHFSKPLSSHFQSEVGKAGAQTSVEVFDPRDLNLASQ